MAENQTHSNFYVSLVTCKNEEDPFKNEGARAPIVSLCRFFMMLKGS